MNLDLSHYTNLKTIGEFAIPYASNSVLELPASIEYIGINALGSTISVCKFNSVTPPQTDYSDCFNSTILLVPEESESAYKNHPVWGECQIIANFQKAEVTVSTPGRLAIDIVESTGMSPAEITHLTLHGAINATDFGIIRSNMTKLLYLNLADTKPILSIASDTTYGIPPKHC